AANYALLIKQVVIELRNRAPVNAAQDEDATLVQSLQRRRNDVASRSKDDSRVEFERRHGERIASPNRAELYGKLLMLFAPGGRVNLHAPVQRHLNCHVSG